MASQPDKTALFVADSVVKAFASLGWDCEPTSADYLFTKTVDGFEEGIILPMQGVYPADQVLLIIHFTRGIDPEAFAAAYLKVHKS